MDLSNEIDRRALAEMLDDLERRMVAALERIDKLERAGRGDIEIPPERFQRVLDRIEAGWGDDPPDEHYAYHVATESDVLAREQPLC